MSNFGASLKNARRKKSLSLKRAAQTLKTEENYLKSFEGENYAKLPPRVYARGLLKKYCDLLGLPSKKFLKILEGKYSAGSKTERLQTEGVGKRTINKIIRAVSFNFKTWFLLAVFAAIFIYLLVGIEDVFGRPKIEIFSPKDGIAVEDSKILVWGEVEGVFKDFAINNQKIGISGEGNFRESIFLKPGVNEIVVSASNLFGKKSEEKIQIVRVE